MSVYTSSRFIRLPLEIIDAIAFELSALQPLGPPSILLSLLCSCRDVYYSLCPRVNPALWARIFRYKFDSNAVERRMFSPTQNQCVEQLVRYCRAMQTLRCKNRFHGSDPSFLDDIPLEDALMTAVVMMLEDDGKNVRQLCEWAHADHFTKFLVRNTMFAEMRSNNGWPVENKRNACAVWLLWMLTAEESLKKETPEERSHIISVLLPFVTFPYRYPSSEAPPQRFRLPFPPALPTLPTTIQTAHGPYPVWPPMNRSIVEVHYESRPTLNIPLIAPAAKLLFFARQELTPLPTPPHLARNRAELLERVGHMGVALTREDLDEFNWGWSARLPQGLGADSGGLVGRRRRDRLPSWRWGVGDTISFDFTEEKDHAGRASSCVPFAEGSQGPNDGPEPRWAGKAPHAMYTFNGAMKSKSARWDADWWRMRLCGDPRMMRTRVPYGRLFLPGSMDSLWHGRLLMPAEAQLQTLLANPLFPGEQFNEQNMRFVVQPMYIRLREAHDVVGAASTASADLGTLNDEDEDGNMNNAWFDGAPGSTNFRVRHALEGEGVEGGSEDQEVAEIVVRDAAGRTRSRVFPCWKCPRGAADVNEGLGLGNVAFSQGDDGVDDVEELGEYGKEQGPGEEDDWTRYPHEANVCPVCQARLRVKRQLEREEAAERDKERLRREALFASVGLGMEQQSQDDDDDDDPEDSSSSNSYDTELDELEPFSTAYTTPDGVTHPALPRTHDRFKLANGSCDGVREVYVVGGTDGRHRDAWGEYEFYGRVREWDGLIGVLRKPKGDGPLEVDDRGCLFFYGYLVGGDNWVGNWRFSDGDGGIVGYEGAFVMSRRYD